MYCMQWLLPLLFIPKPISPIMLQNHLTLLALYLTDFLLVQRPCALCSIVFIIAVGLLCYSGIGNCVVCWKCQNWKYLLFPVLESLKQAALTGDRKLKVVCNKSRMSWTRASRPGSVFGWLSHRQYCHVYLCFGQKKRALTVFNHDNNILSQCLLNGIS